MLSLNDLNYIKVPEPKKKMSVPIPIISIKINDARFDTVSFGFSKQLRGYHNGELRIKNGFSYVVRNFFSEILDIAKNTNEGIELVAYIKKCFLSDFIFIDLNEDVKLNSKKLDKDEFSGVNLLIEFYAKSNGNYYPLYRYDTTITGVKDVSVDGGSYLSKALTGSLEKLSYVDWQKIRTKGRVLKDDELTSHYSSRMNLPGLEIEKIKGVYFSFEEFKTNKPGILYYIVQKSEKGDFLYIKNKNGEDSLCRDIWGYCDGKDQYIYSAGNFFLLKRQRNSFRFLGAKELSSYRTIRLNARGIDLLMPNSAYSKGQTLNKYVLRKTFFLLDMDNGDFY